MDFWVRFAYLFPRDDQSRKRRAFNGIYMVLSLGALVYCSRYAYQSHSLRTPFAARYEFDGLLVFLKSLHPQEKT